MDFDYENQDHYRHTFDSFRESFVLLSPLEFVDCAIVFVHGHGGDPDGTWADFHLMVDSFEPCVSFYADSDLYFFRYASRDEWIHASTDRLLYFLDELIFKPNPVHFTEDIRPVTFASQENVGRDQAVSVLPSPRKYKNLILVGHSQGAVIIRNAILKRAKSKTAKVMQSSQRKVLLRAELYLFAPAIAGFRPTGILGALMNMPWLGSVLKALMSSNASYQDLSDVEFLKELKSKTEAAAKASPQTSAFRANIAWGYQDKVVHPTKYNDDYEEFVDQDHIQICKPCDANTHPIQFVCRGFTSHFKRTDSGESD